jgi:two-component system sensor histidine kinase VicK
MRSLRMKLVMIMVILILALMTVIGAFMINGVGDFYISEFYVQMSQTFSKDFIAQLQDIPAQTSDAPAQMKELLMAQSGLGIDITNRNVYILDMDGRVLASSDESENVSMTANLLTAMNSSQIGQDSSITSAYMDLAVPIRTDSGNYIVYILDNKATVDALTSQVLTIILKALGLGLVICVVLSFLLAQILITPIQALTVGTRQVAAGDFSQKLEVTSHDEIGVLTRNFNYMAQVLQDTLSDVENERNKLSTLFLHMTDGVVAFNTAGAVIHFNPAATQMLGRSMDPTTTFQEIFSGDADFSKLLALKRPQYLEAQKTVGERELELFMAPFSSPQTQGGALVVIHDVTEQRKNEQARREFVANVSHELRTPLTNIKSYAETIVSAGDDLSPELRTNFLGVIIGEADRMTRIVQDLLTLSKIDYGKMEMNITRFSFAEAVKKVYEAAVMNARSHGHTMSFHCEEHVADVNGDRERIEQVVMNIVSNSIKYTPDGGKIELAVGQKGQTVYVRISDNGIGIPEKDLPRLFERFYRVDKARSRESGGTGLGLSIAKEILKEHKGDIRIDSVCGEGTDVLITLPAAT